jgi:HEAT repeat protein
MMLIVICIGCSKSTDDLIKDIENGTSRQRLHASAYLSGKRGNHDVTKKIIALLDSKNERTIFIAAQILGSRADTSAVIPLGRLVDNPNHYIREKVVWSLGSIGHDSAFPYIEKALDDSVSTVRKVAAEALGYLYYPPAAKHLYKMFRDKADSVRVAAVYSLYLYRADKKVGVKASDFAVPLNDNSELVRFVAAQALGWSYPDSTVAGQLLIDALSDQSKFVRLEAITSLNKIKYNNAVPYLKKMYDTATVEEEYSISETIKNISGEVFPPQNAN